MFELKIMHCLQTVLVFILTSVLYFASAEFFTAIAELEKLLETEKEISKTLETYLKSEEERLEKVKWLSKQYSNLHSAANKDVDQFLSNPVNAYLLVKRLTADWDTTSQLIDGSESRAVIASVTSQMLNFPSSEDLSGAAEALIRLQDIYLLNTSTIANGQIKGTNISTKLTANDCFVLGKQAYYGYEYNHSLHWMQESLKHINQEDMQTVHKTDILEYMALSSHALRNYTAALEYTEQIIALDPDHPRAPHNLEFYRAFYASYEAKKRAKGDTEEEDIPHKPSDNTVEELPPEIVYGYEKLCRGESMKTPEEKSKLKCYRTNNNNSYLLLQPAKIEVLNLKPKIMMYHDVLNDREATIIKSIATPKLARATVSNGTTGKTEVASYRISKSAWLNDYEHPAIPIIGQRIQAITGLDEKNSEALHVINYGIGGHYEPHFDFADEDDKVSFMEHMGNRIATWIFYLSDVPAGGSTVFPTIGVEVKPIKGAAAFWYNLFKNGHGDQNTRHAACPVLSGSKWVANKWLHERGNEFKRPCSLDPVE